MTEGTTDLLPVPAAGVVRVELSLGMAALASDAGSLLRLSATGALVWDCLPQGGTAEELALDLADAFDARTAVVRADVDAFIASLLDLGLVTASGAGDADDDASPLRSRSKPHYLDTEPNG